MWKSAPLNKKLTVRAVLTMGLFLSSGCYYFPRSRVIGDQYYLMDIPVCAHGVDQSEFRKTQTPADNSQNRPAITDQTIIDCKTTIVNILRDRMNNARLGRTAGGFIQVVTAAASAMFTGTAGSSALSTATILSGTSAIIPEISSVIEAKERAEVYSKGIKLIEEAYAQYLEQMTSPAEEGPSTVQPPPSGATLSPAGAVFYGKLVAAVHVVESGLAGQLPTLEELQKASPSPLDVSIRFVNLKAENSQDVKVTRGGPLVSAASNNPKLVTAEIKDGSTATLTAAQGGQGEAKVLFRNGSGGIATVTVNVTP